MKLIELPNGDWVDPSTIYAIRPLPLLKSEGTTHPWRAVVEYSGGGFAGHGSMSIVECSQEDELREFVASLVSTVNATHATPADESK